MDWTTNVWPSSWGTQKTVAVDGYGVETLNTYGQHYWMLDVQMDCSKAVNGLWFEFKTYIKNGAGWEANVSQSGTPYTSGNHFAQCGKVNVFQRGVSAPVSTKTMENPRMKPSVPPTSSRLRPVPSAISAVPSPEA